MSEIGKHQCAPLINSKTHITHDAIEGAKALTFFDSLYSWSTENADVISIR